MINWRTYKTIPTSNFWKFE